MELNKVIESLKNGTKITVDDSGESYEFCNFEKFEDFIVNLGLSNICDLEESGIFTYYDDKEEAEIECDLDMIHSLIKKLNIETMSSIVNYFELTFTQATEKSA